MKSSRWVVAFLSMFIFANQSWAKDLYMTVFRDYGSDESPVIEVNYRARKPIHFRLLKPKDMRGFIASQIDLKRAWKQPKVEFNSLRYLKMGLNQLSWRTDWIRRAADKSLRDGLKNQYGGGSFAKGVTPLQEGQQKIVAFPEQFELVSEVMIYPEATDAIKPFDVPGFDEWYSAFGSGYKSKSVSLPKLKPGFYLVQVTQGPLEGQIVLVVNDILAEVQQSDSEAIVRASHRTGEDLAGGLVEVRNIQGQWAVKAELNSQGTAHLKGLPPGPLLFVFNDRRDQLGTAIVDAEFLPSSTDFPDIYLYSDRPVYRPGDDILVKGILRKARGGLSRILNVLSQDDSKIATHLEDVDQQVKGNAEQSSLNSFGTFNSTLKAPNDGSGLFRIKSQFAGAAHIGEIRVQEYVKPLYYLTAKTEQETLRAGETLKVQVRAERFAGGAPKGMVLRADLYRERYSEPEWIETEGLAESGSLKTYGFDQSQHQSPSLPIVVASMQDLKFDDSGFLNLEMKVPDEVPGDPLYDYTFRLNLFAYDPSGESASTSLTFLDTRSDVIGQIKNNLVMIKKGASYEIKVLATSPSGTPLPSIQGAVVWSIKPYQGDWTKVSEQPFETAKDGLMSLKVPTERVGELEANVVLLDSKGRKTESKTSLMVMDPKTNDPVSQVENLSLITNTSQLRNGESAEILVLLPEKWGENASNSGNLNVTVAGRSIFYTKKIAHKGTSVVLKINGESRFGSSFYVLVSYPDGQKGWVEEKLGFTIIPVEKILKISMDFANKELSPASEQRAFFKVTDYQGRPVTAEIALSVVDEAVYRVHQEFRPKLVDFFYPPERLNLMSFVSHHFQSFGYGEKIAGMFRPNFSHGAPKPEKPKTDRDTAYWNPSIQTRDDGTAEVNFTLPTNQTIWRATAVVVDQNGSFGEIQGQFRANRRVSLIASWPRAMRPGDQINMDFKVASSGNIKPERFSVSLESSFLNQLTANSILEGVIKPGSEVHVPIGLQLKEFATNERALVKTVLSLQGDKTEYLSDFRVVPNSYVYSESSKLDANDAATIQTKPGETIEQLKLTVATGLSGTIENAARTLIQYPYGCAEQLASSVLVNVINYKLINGHYVKQVVGDNPIGFWWNGIKNFFKSSWIKIKSLRSDKIPALTQKNKDQLVADSSKFFHSGLLRLKQYQNDDGSLVWWPGLGQSDLSMTLLVLYSILNVDDVDLNETFDVLKAWRWLETQPLTEDSPQMILRLAIFGRLVDLGLLPKPDRSHFSFSQWQFLIEKHTKQNDHPENLRDLAWITLGLVQSGLSQDPDFQQPLKSLQEALNRQFDLDLRQGPKIKNSEDLSQNAVYQGRWQNYPGTPISHLAIAGKALHLLGQMPQNRLTLMTTKLLSHFDGSRFQSTFETAMILGHSEYILSREAFNLAYQFHKPRISFQTREIDGTQVQYSPHIGGYSAIIPIDPTLAGQHELKVSGLSATDTGTVRIRKTVNYKDIKPYLSAWNIERRIYLVDQANNKIQEVAPTQIKIGDILYIQIRYGAKQGMRPSAYLMVEDSLPTGFAPIMEDKIYTTAPWNFSLRPKIPFKREFLVDRVRFHLQVGSSGAGEEREVGYLVRAVHQGTFQGGIIRIEDMYQEQNYSHLVTPVMVVRRS